MDIVERIDRLFASHGHVPYEGARREAISALEHALQCAQLAEWAHADSSLVAAAFLHDVGHFLAAEAVARNDHVDDRHEELVVPFLAEGFDAAVTEPVRLHVQAKRYLVRIDDAYARSLSPASVHSLALQGGPMRDDEMERFEDLPFAREAVQLRRWDDLAKEPGRRTPSIDWYLALLEDLRERPFLDSKTGIGAGNVA
ncbi:MAG: HD domain-containing protein [Piscinibacter sp.]|uniref:HD domain-containing protein n=1 Tax=Piscinibacter sp. TaxID=1903157 RepID=UPI003D13E5C3